MIVLGFIVSGWRIEPHKIISIIPNSYILYSNQNFLSKQISEPYQSQLKRGIWKPPLATIIAKKKHPSIIPEPIRKIHTLLGNLHWNTDNVIIINIAKNMQRIAVRCVHFAECLSTISNFAFEVHFAYGVMCRCVYV